MQSFLKYLKGDKVIWIVTILLLCLSILSVYSFIPILIKVRGGTPFSYLFKHMLYVGLGFFAMFWIHNKDPKYLQKSSKFIFYVAIALLIFTFFFGLRINDATRWVRVPIIGITFQSSDFAKFALVVFLAQRLTVKRGYFDSWKKSAFSFMIPVFLVCGLIAKDNFSTAAILFLVALLILFIAQFPFSKILGMIGAGIASFGLIVLVHFALPALNFLPRLDTWINRIFRAYGDHGPTVENMQAINAKLAIFNGGYTGVGVGNGELKRYIPEAYADFYYSSFVEEFGLIGAVFLIFLYLILFYRIFRIGLNAKSLFETFTSIGIGIILLSQVLVNMLVCTGIMPVTGQIMPFLAMGGSAMVMSCVALGIIQSIANKNNPKDNLSEELTKSKTE